MDEDGEGQDEFMIGGAAIIVRLGYFLVTYVLATAQSLCGYRGASLPLTVMAPREVRKTPLLRPRTIILPRQARDSYRKS
eukprot:COSAG06_NODE_4756_length_3981_cov_1.911901_4_plen_80_part_00